MGEEVSRRVEFIIPERIGEASCSERQRFQDGPTFSFQDNDQEFQIKQGDIGEQAHLVCLTRAEEKRGEETAWPSEKGDRQGSRI